MKTYGQWAPTGFDTRGAFLPEQQDWLVAPVCQTRDSGPLDKSNFQAMLELLGGESETVQVHRFGHWGPGWFEIILIDPKDTAAVKTADDAEASLMDYPALDDEAYSKLEYEEYLESWDYWGRRDYTKELWKALCAEYPDGFTEEFDDCDVESAFDDFTAEQIDSFQDNARRGASWVYETDGDGVTINISGLVKATDKKKVLDLAIEAAREQVKARDIRKLAAILGANEDQQAKAVQGGLVFVSQIRNLLTSSGE